MVTLIHSSDVAMLAVIKAFRELKLNLTEILGVGTFIADKLRDKDCCRRCKDKDSFLNGLQVILRPSLFKNFHRLMRLRDFDELFDLFNTAKNIFIPMKNYSPNEAVVPSIIKRDSLVGLYIRGIVAKWTSLCFSSACDVYEEYVGFCNGSVQTSRCAQLPYATCVANEVGPHDHILAAENAMLQHDTFSALTSIHKYFDVLDKEKINIL